jgi:hypothetical protein
MLIFSLDPSIQRALNTRKAKVVLAVEVSTRLSTRYFSALASYIGIDEQAIVSASTVQSSLLHTIRKWVEQT